jgi:hypothetical protein
MMANLPSFALGGFEGILGNYATPPYSVGLLTELGYADPDCPSCVRRPCRFPWNSVLCQPEDDRAVVRNIWITLILLGNAYFPWISWLLLGMAGLGSIIGVVKRSLPIFLIFGHFFVLNYLHGLATVGGGRYPMVSYPFEAILIAYFFVWLLRDIPRMYASWLIYRHGTGSGGV